MTVFNDVNRNAASSEFSEVATGPRVSFLQHFEDSYEAQRRASSMFGIERAMNESIMGQASALYGAGEKGTFLRDEENNVDLDRLDIPRFFEEGGNEEQSSKIQKYDDYILSMREKKPDLKLKTLREMWDDVKFQAQDAERRVAAARTTTMGDVGGFIGGAIASVDPRTDPLNTLTLGVGAVGKSLLKRVATQAGGQAAIETVNQITGVQEERRLLGLDHGFADAVSRVAGAAIGGAAIQGAGELVMGGLKMAGKRFFRDLPHDKAPPPPADLSGPAINRVDPIAERDVHDLMSGATKYDDLAVLRYPMGDTRMGKARTAMDIDYVTMRLEAWDGEAPAFVKPQASTRIPNSTAEKFELEDFQTLKEMMPKTVDEAARKLDPKVFDVYDKLAARKTELRAQIDNFNRGRNPTEDVSAAERQTVTDAVNDLTNRIEELKHQKEDGVLSNRKLKDLDKRIQQLEAERKDNMTRLDSIDRPEASALRNELLAIDVKMRDMAEVVSRAYARARQEWQLPSELKGAVRQMVREGSSVLPDVGYTRTVKADKAPQMFEEGLTDKAPILNQAYKVEDKLRPGADAADIAAAIVKENMKIMDETLEAYRGSLNKMLNEKEGTLTVAGTDVTLRLDKDKIFVPNEDGSGGRSMTIRQLLEENRETELDLEATKKCSI
ncbi:hypothetical protein EKK58_09310 [Candidatus Dependentiae bacterium]|nr:MAG: hypothetical protein EKK58_09310 [Candidatus Dependentiae bacterium]